MRDFSVALKAGLASEVTTLGWLMAITRRDGTVIRLNTMGADYTFDAQSYKAYPGFNMGSARFTDSLEAATLAQGSAADSLGPITFTDAVAGLYSGARVRLFLIDWTTGEGSEIGFKWEVGTINVKDNGETSFDIWSALRTNHALFIKKFGPPCSANLGDDRCGVDIPNDFEDAVVVVTYISAFSCTVSGVRLAAQAADWFQDGAMAIDDGENEGMAYDIRRSSYAAGVATITFRQPLRRPLAPGATARIHPGCDKTTGANGCTRFANNARYQGFLHLPDDQTAFGVEVTDTGQPAVTVPTEQSWISSGWGSW